MDVFRPAVGRSMGSLMVALRCAGAMGVVSAVGAVSAAGAVGAVGAAACCTARASGAELPPPQCASQVVSYAPGVGAGINYQNPNAALGPPTRMTGSGASTGVVSPFQPPFMPGEVVSVGRGGWLVLQFDPPVVDDPRHPFGVDLIVYGNSFFGDLGYPGGVVGFLFEEGGTVELSSDGTVWHAVPGAADGGLPTMAYLDAGPYQAVAGQVPCDPAWPVDPAVQGEDLVGMDYSTLQLVYAGACGGTSVDLAAAGLQQARFVRISVAANAASVPEVDAVVAVRVPQASADLDGSGVVDGTDLGLLLGAWGTAGPGDLDGNNVVDGTDLGMLLGAWS